MPSFGARVRSVLRTRAFVFLAVVAAGTAGASKPGTAAEIALPADAAALAGAIRAQCPTCAAAGFVPCGSPDVGWGRRFAPHALLGRPARGYLVGFVLAGGDFRVLARRTPYETLLATLRARFAAARLVVVEDGFARARVLPPPERVAVVFPKALHECVADPGLAWGCCAADCAARECCEKGLGSPTVALEWRDGDERVTFHYAHTIGDSWMERRRAERRIRYACLTDARGDLRSHAVP